MDQARQYYEDAVKSQPGYSLALCGLAGFHSMQYTFTTDPATLHLAADYAQKAIDADPTLADAWNWLGYANQRLGRVEQAYKQFHRAIRADPNLYFHTISLPVSHRSWASLPRRSPLYSGRSSSSQL